MKKALVRWRISIISNSFQTYPKKNQKGYFILLYCIVFFQHQQELDSLKEDLLQIDLNQLPENPPGNFLILGYGTS